ncbi:biotin-dependent carboxyltransferase family protein [Egicoccus halophilus]|uniref:Allophanate hydrolase n=1 Tax=Egicoccus halophilus TaxID=1670830 RepID=A0A8J3ETM0_9ACTN|nr:biotin-dependent carboxyltransferase family protein [Egicoccus halophilus]GGI04205.1 allophanate hydrolase [Egicoccus halophilus]
MSGGLEVLASGPLATVQDLGRPGHGGWGVPGGGAADRAALRLANRLVGNPEGAAGLEVTLGGLQVRAAGSLVVAVTGARAPATVDGAPVDHRAAVRLPAGATLALGTPPTGLRSYLGVRGGLDVPAVLGSRATDVLSGLGPAVLAAGDRLPVGAADGAVPPVDVAPRRDPHGGEVTLRLRLGPRADWFPADARSALTATAWTVTPDSNRVGLRLDGPPLERAHDDELPTEGLMAGAVQVPPSGRPTLFLADHPVTGGYPVIGVVLDGDLDVAGQLRPGQRVRFRAVANRDLSTAGGVGT